MVLNIFFLPLLGFVTALGFGKFLGRRGVSIVTTSLIGVCCFLSYLNLFELLSLEGNSYTIVISPWVLSGLLEFNWCFFCDSLTSIMLVVVCSVVSPNLGPNPDYLKFLQIELITSQNSTRGRNMSPLVGKKPLLLSTRAHTVQK